MRPIVEVRGLTFRWPGGRLSLQDVNLVVRAGERVALVGANGAGKSTLLHILGGLLTPSGGEVRVADRVVGRATLREVRRTVGLVLQDPDDQLFLPTVAEDVAFGPLNAGLPRDEVARRVDNILDRLGVAHLRDRPHHQLSAGEKRLCALAAVLVMEPTVLSLDEPSSHLDPRARRRLIQLLGDLALAQILVTHDLDMALDLCPRTVVLHEGRVAADGETERILTDAALLEACGLEVPGVRGGPRSR